MIPGKSLSRSDANEEVSALIEVLHKTGKRLEELTAGEVDSVSDHDGRTFVLLSAQEQLRHSEATRQAAILNALPAHIALLDTQGIIISVNEAWRRFACGNALLGPGYAVGVDYLAICDRARGEGAAEAREAAEGIRAVLGGKPNFAMEYACHSPAQPRWFLMTVMRLSDDQPNGVVVMHMDVTTERQSIESLHASESRFRQMAENIRDVFFLRDVASGRMLYISPAYAEIWGQSCESIYENPDSWMDLIHPDDRAAVREKHRAGMLAGGFELEFRLLRADGTIRRIEARGFPVRDAAGVLVRVAGIVEDITERRVSEDRIAYLNRVYAVMSGINTLIVLVRNREELFRQVCEVAVQKGGFRMAWIALVERDTRNVSLVASEGVDAPLLEAVRMGMATKWSASAGQSMVMHVIRDSEAFVANNLQRDAVSGFGPKHAAAGVYSMVMLPLLVHDEVAGVLTLGASEADFFHTEEMKLLTELAGHISYAIDHIEKQDRLDYLAYYDVVTGLANRTLFLERVAQYMRSAATGAHRLALFLIDIERFKNINDSLGRPAGDALLKQVAEWLTRNGGDANLLARVGADQFAMVLPEVREGGDVARLLESTLAVFLEHPFRLNDAVFRIAVKVGVAIFPSDGASADALLRNAEAALKKAKASGERYLMYKQNMTEAAAGKLTLENRLRQALEREEFVLHYQPKVSLASGKITSAEALIRWNDPRAGLVPPARFIPVLEETGLIHDVGRWALRKAIADFLRWRKAGLAAVRIAVNVSPLQLRHRAFIAEIQHVIGVDGLAADGLELEITESVIMEDVRHSITTLKAIRAMGVIVAIDDFGTGFSSLSYLAKLPVDTLKIDRSFVVDMGETPEGLALVSTIISLAHSLRLNTVAEGVETEEQARLLRLLKCDEMQGYLYSKPVPADVFEARHLAPPAAAP